MKWSVPPAFIFTPIIPELSKEEILSLFFKKLFRACCLCCSYITLLFYLLLHPLHSLWLYTSWEKWNGSFSFFFFSGSPDSYHCSHICVQFSIYRLAGPWISQTGSCLTPTPATLIPCPWPVTHCHQPQVMKRMQFLSRNISLPDVEALLFKI